MGNFLMHIMHNLLIAKNSKRMEDKNVIFRPIAYNSLCEYLMFTDFNFKQFDRVVEIDDHIMVEYLKHTNNSICEMETAISEQILQKNKSVKKILLLFSETHSNFFDDIQILVKTCKEHFSKALISIVINSQLNYQKISNADLRISVFRRHFIHATELEDFINAQFLNVQTYFNFARCHHWILKKLEKKFGDSLTILENSQKFTIEENDKMLRFERNSNDKTFSVFESHGHLSLVLTNDHLLGLYNNPCHIFNVVSCLNEIKILCKQDIKIEKDELVLLNSSEKDGINLSQIFEEIILALDKEFNFSKIKIQIEFEKYLVFNRCLKISLFNFWELLKTNERSKLIEKLTDLVLLYFKCFSKKPIVCRMQSLASDATVYDFEKFTYSHIQANIIFYVKISKLLYPHLCEVGDEFFKRIYLEVIPVSLLQRFPNSKVANFIQTFQKLHDLNIAIIPLANGNFRVGSYFNTSSGMLAKLYDPEKLKTAVDFLNDYFEKNEITKKSKFLKQEDFDYSSTGYCEFEAITAFRSMPQGDDEILFGDCLLKIVPKCRERENCNQQRYANLEVFTYNQHIILAYKKESGEFSSKIYKELTIVCKAFAEAFDQNVEPLMLPFCQNYLELLKDVEAKSIFPLNLSSGKNPMRFELNKYKERFWFPNDIPKNHILFIHEIAKCFIDFESTEGIYFVFIKNTIEIIENMNMTIAEMDPDYYKATADYCFYNEDDLLIFFGIIKEFVADVKDLFFEVTNLGWIKFNNTIEIRPSTFLRVRNKSKLVLLIKYLCKVLQKNKSEMCSVVNEEITSEEKIETLILGAKRFNPLLNCLKKEDFELPAFLCIPLKVFSSIEKVVDYLITLRQNRPRIQFKGEMILIDNCCFDLNILKCNSNFTNHSKMNEILEKVNENFDDIVVIRHPPYFDVIDYDAFNEQIFNKTITKGINVKEIQSPEHLRQSMKRDKKADEMASAKCLRIFEKCEIIEDVVVLNNESFMINKGFAIKPEHLLKLDSNNQQKLLEATKIFNELTKPYLKLPDNWITLAGEDTVANILSKNSKFASLIIVNDNKDIYLKMAMMFTDMLSEVPREKLLSYKWLKLIPSKVLMNKNSAEKLLTAFEFMKLKGHDVWITNTNALATKLVSLPISKWLKIKNHDAFNDFLDSAYKAAVASMIALESKNTSNAKAFQLSMSGLFSPDKQVKSNNAINYPAHYAEGAVKYMLNLMAKTEKFLPITLNSTGYLMLGNFIWIDCDKLQLIPREFLEMVDKFEKAMDQEDENLMQSIHDFSTQSAEVKAAAIELAKILNKSLKDFADEMICDENLRIFPTQLKNLCNENNENFHKMKHVFQLLEEKQISWTLKFNGNIELGEQITVKVADLLKSSEKDSVTIERIERIKIFINSLSNDIGLKIFCLEEIKYQSNKDERVFRTKIQTYNDILIERESLGKLICRIEPNGTLFINDNLWMNAEDVKNTELILQKSNALKELFPGTKFHYGYPVLSFLPSILTSTDEQLFQYCYNMCQLVIENYSNESDPSSKATIEYIAERNIFRFNNLLPFHPRSFFHLQKMDDVIKILKDFEKNKIKNPNFLKTHEVSPEERTFYQELQKIKQTERVEFDVIREKCFISIGEIIWNSRDVLKEIGNIKNVVDFNKPFFGETIFQHGVANAFISILENGTLTFNYIDKQITDALKFANNLDETYKCRNLFHFHSCIEIIIAYPTFLAKHHYNSGMSQQDHINWWLEKVQEQQEKPRKYKFGNVLKGLHHWFKHYKGFNDLEDYYEKMNTFFETAEYTIERDTQNGDFISREYKKENYVGSYMIAHDDCQREDCVATFYIRKSSLNFKNYDENNISKYLVITGVSFKKFLSDKYIILNNEIMVNQPNNTDLKSLISYFERNLKVTNPDNVEKLLLFLPKREVPFVDSLKNLIKTIRKKFKQTQITLCHSSAQEVNLVEEKFDSISISGDLIEKKDAAELKIFIENQFFS